MMSGTYSNAPCTEEGYNKISITLAKLVEFFVISFFHETKIPMVDMKVLGYSNFSKNKIRKKIKSPSSTSVGHASKNGGVVYPFSQKAWPIPQTSQKKLKN
jgi:hypothetical protein